MSYLKIWNEEIMGFEVFDIGTGRFRVNSEDWVLVRFLGDLARGWEFIKYTPEDDLSSGSLPTEMFNNPVNLSVDEIFFDYGKAQRVEWKHGDYQRMKIVSFGVNTVNEMHYSVAVPYGSAPIYHVNENGQTIDRY